MSFCHQCSQVSVAEGRSAYHADTLPVGYGDLAGLVEKGRTCMVLCEGCGEIEVDHLGRCLAECPAHADEGYP